MSIGPRGNPRHDGKMEENQLTLEMAARDPELYKIRHSLAHILAQAVLELRPGSKLGFGPPIEDGFYYDFILSSPLTEADFSDLEKKMRQFLQAGHLFEREEVPLSTALSRIDEMGEPYKREYAAELAQKKSLSTLAFYRTGPFLDMCDGPHVENTRNIRPDCFKLRAISGAYWRGDSSRQMMTRIYAYAYKTKAELDLRQKEVQLALERDHKKLGKELELFFTDDEIGRGLPLWLPNGTVLRDELESFAKELEFRHGYQRVSTPVLARESLYLKTGHLPYYADGMYPPMTLIEKNESADGNISESVKERYYLRPMNCPHHHKIFSSKLRSYRELPLRLAEFGSVFRYEDSGSVQGLMRVRGMCQNDAHIYCTADQVEDEVNAVINMHKEAYQVFGFENYWVRLSLWDPEDPKVRDKYIHDPEGWQWCEQKLREILKKSGIRFYEMKGEAAFYGPKIDFQFRTVTGRDETASTCQLDFGIAGRLGLTYKGADNVDHTPYVIHRAPLGTLERMSAFLIEHTGGAFPTWLAPTQVRVLTVNDSFQDYGRTIVASLRSKNIRAELDESSETLGKRIRTGVKSKIPYLLVLGEKESTQQTVTLRAYGSEAQLTLSLEQFELGILKEIRARTRERQVGNNALQETRQ